MGRLHYVGLCSNHESNFPYAMNTHGVAISKIFFMGGNHFVGNHI